jgi:hypothetical protein
MKFFCQTLFDITVTGVTGHFKVTRTPFTDSAGQRIYDQQSWDRSRNQQRNWETLTQILGLRTQLFELTDPVQDSTGTRWMFEFETDRDGVFGPDADPCEILRADSEGVPMLRELNNDPDIEPYLCTHGARQNIWFAPLPINNKL